MYDSFFNIHHSFAKADFECEVAIRLMKLEKEKIGFIVLGIFSYSLAFIGLYHIVARKFFRKKKR